MPSTSAVTTTTMVVGQPVDASTLEVGDCFNRYEIDKQAITAKVPCDGPHQREAFAVPNVPTSLGQAWPGGDTLERFGLRLCYEKFEEFVGKIYELSDLAIGIITPPRSRWEATKPSARRYTCFVQQDEGHEPLVGSMRGTAI